MFAAVIILFMLLMLIDCIPAFAEYTPLITTGFFDGVAGDVMSAASGWLGVVVAIAGAMLIIRTLTK